MNRPITGHAPPSRFSPPAASGGIRVRVDEGADSAEDVVLWLVGGWAKATPWNGG